MEQTNHLYQHSLKEGWKETKSYEIKNLFLVAFFGGVIPLLILGTKNATWLKVSRKVIFSLIGLGILLISMKFMFIYFTTQGISQIDNSTIRYGYKIGCVLLYLLYLKVMKKPFQQHMVTVEHTLSILKPAIVWMIVGMIVELILLSLVI